jgi:type II secretory pathway component PulK
MTKQHSKTECRKGDHTILPGGVRASGFVISLSFGFRHSSFHRGSALIAVFWMIAVMGMVVLAGAKALQADTQATRELRGRTFAKRLAQMGLEVARHPTIQMDDGLLHYTSPEGGGYDVKLTTEEARLNINTLLASGDKVLLPRLFGAWGLKPDQSGALIDALRDWIDEDDKSSLNGAEKRDYQKAGFEGLPFNKPFREVDEMLMVRGMDDINIMRPDWREWFTVMGDGRVDVNEARAELIALIANVPIERVTPLLTLRAGKDGAMHTRDDNHLSSPVQVAQLLGVYQPQTVELLTRWIQFAGPIKRLESTGYFGDIRRRLVLIVQNQQAIWRGELPIHGTNS